MDDDHYHVHVKTAQHIVNLLKTDNTITFNLLTSVIVVNIHFERRR